MDINIKNNNAKIFNKLHEKRKNFMQKNKNNDTTVIEGTSNILISAPHGVSQVRLGKYKFKEIGSVTTALALQEMTNCFLVAKTKNSNDDANFDINCHYRKVVDALIQKNNIKFLIDLHGLSKKQNCDINFGIHLGKNIENNTAIFNKLKTAMLKSGFTVSVDQPFMGGYQTISGYFKNKYPDIWTIQIEINCSITNELENYEKFCELLNILSVWISSINKV